MKIISFGETPEALLAGVKTATRRTWTENYARSFRAGELVSAWDKSPRTGTGRAIATIRLTQAPALESTATLTEDDFVAEGFEFIEAMGALVFGKRPRDLFEDWRANPRDLWVIRFELVEVLV